MWMSPGSRPSPSFVMSGQASPRTTSRTPAMISQRPTTAVRGLEPLLDRPVVLLRAALPVRALEQFPAPGALVAFAHTQTLDEPLQPQQRADVRQRPAARPADVAGHADRRLDAAVVLRHARHLHEAEALVEAAGGAVRRAQLEMDRADPGDQCRLLEPRDEVPSDAGPLIGGTHREQVQVRVVVPEIHDRERDQPLAVAR